MPSRYKMTKVNGKSRLLHRVIMEKHLGRRLLTSEHVHHRNGNGFDNRLSNLEVLSCLDHLHLHKQIYPLTKHCEVCGNEYTPHPTKRKRAKTCSKKCAYALRWDVRKANKIKRKAMQ